MSKGFGYHVSDSQRRREVIDNEVAIAQFDRVLALPFDLPAWATDGVAEPYAVALTSAEHAAAFGLTVAQAAELADAVDAGPIEWLAEARSVDLAAGWYKRAQDLAADLDRMYGDRIYSREHTRKLRADCVRRLRTAKNALGER